MVDQWNSLNQAAAAVYRHTVLPTKLLRCAELYESGRTVLRKCSTQVCASLYESACTVWSGGGALQEVAAGALSRCLYIIGALSQHYCGHNSTTLHCHALTMLQYHQHNLHSHCVCRSTSLKSSSLAQYRGHNSTLLHYHAITMLQYCTIMLLRYCHNILSQSYDLDIISNRAFIATLETIVTVTKYVYILFSQ